MKKLMVYLLCFAMIGCITIADATYPSYYPNAVLDGTLDNYDAWKPIETPRLDEGSYGVFSNGIFYGYAIEGQGDDWGDVVIQTGRKLHGSGYFNVALKNEWYISFNISDGEFLLHFRARNLMTPQFLTYPQFPVAAILLRDVALCFAINSWFYILTVQLVSGLIGKTLTLGVKLTYSFKKCLL